MATPVHALDLSLSPDLELGVTNPFVTSLQQLLNSNGYTVNPTAGQPGSVGNETNYFGKMTQSALSKFQSAFNISPTLGYFGGKTRAILASGFLSQILGSVSSGTLSSGYVYNIETNYDGCVNGRTSELSYYGVTLTFATTTESPEFPRCGQFANGEPWLSAPVVTITNVDNPPVPSNSPNDGGAMINPIPQQKQGFSSRYDSAHRYGYDPDLNVLLNYPFTVLAGESLVVSRSTVTENPADQIESIVGFVVLDEVPPSGSFRPGLYGTEHKKVQYTVNDIDWSILKNFDPVPDTLSQQHMEHPNRLAALPLWDWSSAWDTSAIRPYANSSAGDGWGFRSNYGREVAAKWSRVALWLNTNNPRSVKEKTMIQTIQSGIDIGSYFDYGGNFHASGGHQVGYKFPLVLAAATLDDQKLKDYASAPNKFVEDLTTFFVTQNDVGRYVLPGNATYTQADADAHLPEWGIMHALDSSKDDNRWRDGVPYRFAQWPSMTGSILATEIMGLKNLWNHPVIFPYTERHERLEGLGSAGMEAQMWYTYKSVNDANRIAPVTITTNNNLVDLALTTTALDVNNIHVLTGDTTQTVVLNSSTTDVQIRYTLDGSIPTKTSTLYTGPLTIEPSLPVTLKTVAFKAGMIESDQSVIKFKFNQFPEVYVLSRPNILFPKSNNIQFSPRMKFVTLSWEDQPSTKYNIRGIEYLDSTKTIKTVSPERRYWENSDNQWFGWRDYVFLNDYHKRTMYVPVEPGRYYDFTVTGFHKDEVLSYGEPQGPTSSSKISFSVGTNGQITIGQNYNLAITTSGTGSGTITRSPDQASYTSGTLVTLTATPGVGSVFLGWSGACSGTSVTCSITMTSNKTVTANFELTSTNTPPSSDDSDSDGVPNSLDKCASTPTSLKSTVNMYGCPKPTTTALKIITDMQTTDITNIPNLVVEDSAGTKGKISFNQPINIFGTSNMQSQINLDTYIQFGDRKVTVSSSSQFNKPATITLYNVKLTKPLIKRNGLSANTSYTYDTQNRTLTFTVDGFSTYEVVEK